MRIRKTLKGFHQGSDVTLLFSCGSLRETRGKYLVGFHGTEKDHLFIVFDESASFHKDIALRYRLRARGGGWLELNSSKKTDPALGPQPGLRPRAGPRPDAPCARNCISRIFLHLRILID